MHPLHERLFAQAIAGEHPIMPRLYSDQLSAGVAKNTAKLRLDPREGPFVVTSLKVPGNTGTISAAYVDIRQGKRQYTDGPVRSCAIGPLTGSGTGGYLHSLPAPIIIGANGQLLVNVELDTGTFGASDYVHASGFHTTAAFAEELRADGELYAASLHLAMLAATPRDTDESILPLDALVAWYVAEEVDVGGGALISGRITLGGLDILGDTDKVANALPALVADPRSFLGLYVEHGQKLMADFTMNTGTSVVLDVTFAGARRYTGAIE